MVVMTQIDLSSYRDLYLKTAKEYLEKLNHNLKILSTEPTNPEAIEEAHLCAHSIGSQSLTMQYTTTGNLARVMEHYLSQVKDKTSQLNQESLDALQEASQKLAESISSIETSNSELDLNPETDKIKQKLNIN